MAFHGINLPDAALDRLAAGAPALTVGELGGATGLEPGRPLRLLNRGGEVVGSAIADPENGLVHLLARELVRAFDAGFFRARAEAAVALRRSLGLVDGVSAYRMVNAEGDALPGLWADAYGPFLVIGAASRGLLPYARMLAEALVTVMGAQGAVLKVRAKDPQDKTHKDEVIGERPPEKLVVEELGARYEVHLLGALNVGLFSDMREHRRGIGRWVMDRSVLNTFAYTGALSVAAARAGARAVTTVDLSSGVLAWAKENFRLSGLPTDDGRHRFETSDVRRFMERERSAGKEYDMVILDPPTVSAARASQWSMKKDYPDLIALATRLLPEGGGHLWVSGNNRKGPGVLDHVREGLRRAARVGVVLELGGLPPDFPTPADWPEARYLDVCQLRVL